LHYVCVIAFIKLSIFYILFVLHVFHLTGITVMIETQL